MTDLRGSSLRRRRLAEDINPGDGVMNLADVMLVFATGLLAAIVSFWNVDLPKATELVDQTRLQQLDGASQPTPDQRMIEGGYDELGTVYQDPETGQLFMIV